MNARLLAVCLAGCTAAAPPVDHNPRTAVLVVLDTVRNDHLALRPEVAPRFAALTAGATRFSSAWAQAPWTLPSHATLFTGLEPAEHGCTHATLHYDGRAPLLAQRFAEAGYQTGGFSNNPWLSDATGLDAGFQTYVEVFRRSLSSGMAVSRFVDPTTQGITDAGAARTVAAAGEWLDDIGPAPAFLFVNLVEAHLPFDPPDGWRGRLHGRRELISEVREANTRWMQRAHRGVLGDEDRREMSLLYDEEISYVDDRLGALLDTLSDHGRLDDALLVVTADHGEGLGEHRTDGIDLVDHQLSLYDELLHVPLVVRWPGHLPAGEVRSDPVGLLDVFGLFTYAMEGGTPPTLIAGAPANRTLRAAYQPPRVHRDVLAAYIDDPALVDRLAGRGLRAVRQGSFKLLLPDGEPPRLYDLAVDPGEETDVAVEHPDRVAQLVEQAPPPSDEGSATVPEATIEALRALGYVP